MLAASAAGWACGFGTARAAADLAASSGADDADLAGFANLYVAPGPSDGGATLRGSGTAADPLLLSAGGEYLLNRAIRPFMDAGRKLAVRFGPGVYRGVRLQILRQGTDRDMIYLTHRQGDAIAYYNTTQCNAAGQNCRVQPPDYAIGRDRDAPLALLGDPSGGTVFDGAGLDGLPQIEDEALLIAGASHGPVPVACDASSSPHIRNVLVAGLVFRNYTNGIQVSRAEDVVVRGCGLDQIGNRLPRGSAVNGIGTFALRVDGWSRRVLLDGNVVTNVWNSATATDPSGAADPGLIHAIYQGYACDVVFRGNSFTGCSGPMVKFGFYPAVQDGTITCQYPVAPRERCTVLLNNRFVLQVMQAPGGPVPIYAPQQAFVEENSMETEAGVTSAPAGGVLFLNNQFENRIQENGVPVLMLRQELPAGVETPQFPDWLFAGNRITGIAANALIGTRERGTPVSTDSIRFVSEPQALHASLQQQAASSATPLAPVDARQAMQAALLAMSSAADQNRNAALLAMTFGSAAP